MGELKIVIDDEVVTLDYINDNQYKADNGCSYYIFCDCADAGEYAKSYYENMIMTSKDDFICIVGRDALVDWALGFYNNGFCSVDEWLDDWLNKPEDHWASYDNEEVEITRMNKHMKEEMDSTSCVMYRFN